MQCPPDIAAITPDWLEWALAAGGRWRPSAIRRIDATVIGVGYGLDGTVARLQLEGPAADEPSSLVAKFASAVNGRQERAFYEHLAARMPVRVPRYYGTVLDAEADRSVLLLEDLTTARQGDAIRGASFEDGVAVLRGMARFHAAFARAGPEALGGLPVWDARVERWVEKARTRSARFLDRLEPGLAPALAPLLETLPDRLAPAVRRLERAPARLVHTDLHLDNVLFLDDGAPVYLDWTGARWGSAALDVMRFFVEGARLESRRRHEDAWLAAYVDERAEVGVPVSDRGRWRAELDAALLWHLAYAVGWGGAEEPGFHLPRVPEIVASLSRNTAGAAIDRLA